MSFSCSSEIADVIAFLIFLFDVEKHTVFQTSVYVGVEISLTIDTPVMEWI